MSAKMEISISTLKYMLDKIRDLESRVAELEAADRKETNGENIFNSLGRNECREIKL